MCRSWVRILNSWHCTPPHSTREEGGGGSRRVIYHNQRELWMAIAQQLHPLVMVIVHPIARLLTSIVDEVVGSVLHRQRSDRFSAPVCGGSIVENDEIDRM